MRRFLCAVAFITAASPALAAEAVEDDGSYRMQLSAGLGRFTGDYGDPEKTTLDVLNVSARWYLNRAELQVSVPYLRVDGAADVTYVDGLPISLGGGAAGNRRRTESGFGDVILRGEYYLHSGSKTSPWVIGLLRVKLPTGSEARGLGSGATDVETGIGLIQRYGPINWLADVGYTFVGSSGGLDPKNQLRLGAGASVPFGQDDRHSYYVYFENRTNRYSGSEDRRSIAVGVSAGLPPAKRLRLSASVFFGLTDATEDVGAYLTVGRRF